MANQQPQLALIFIPDISGFTKFVNDTEIIHSQHIIQELIEVIIESNSLGLNVSEIEGDAVLFYRFGQTPSAEEIAGQVKQMFINFHKQLKIIERDRVCHCGACSTAINLTLKFLTHSGEIAISKIKNHEKLIGKDVIIAHRLLKNNIKSNEYILLTENYLQTQSQNNFYRYFESGESKKGMINYEHIGQIKYDYILLSPLKEFVPEIPSNPGFNKFNNPIIKHQFIKAPNHLIYDTIINLDLRKEWTKGLKNIEYNKNEVPKIGTKHNCKFDLGSFELETVHKAKDNKKYEYAERANNNFLLPQSTTFFILEKNNQGTDLTIEFHYKRLPVIGVVIDLLMRKHLDRNLQSSLLNLKNFCEKIIH